MFVNAIFFAECRECDTLPAVPDLTPLAGYKSLVVPTEKTTGCFEPKVWCGEQRVVARKRILSNCKCRRKAAIVLMYARYTRWCSMVKMKENIWTMMERYAHQDMFESDDLEDLEDSFFKTSLGTKKTVPQFPQFLGSYEYESFHFQLTISGDLCWKDLWRHKHLDNYNSSRRKSCRNQGSQGGYMCPEM